MLKEELFDSRQYKAYKAKQKKILRKNKKERMYVDWTGIEYKEGDLYYAVQHATVTCAAFRKGKWWKVQFAIYDTFDFTQIRFPDSIGSAANDMGYVLQHADYFKPFEWSYRENARVKIAKK